MKRTTDNTDCRELHSGVLLLTGTIIVILLVVVHTVVKLFSCCGVAPSTYSYVDFRKDPSRKPSDLKTLTQANLRSC